MVNAVGMYANINTDHAIDCIARWFELHQVDISDNQPVRLLLDSIERLIKYIARGKVPGSVKKLKVPGTKCITTVKPKI